MWQWIINWLKWQIASKEMAELERRKVTYEFHRRWLAEFPDICRVLDRVENEGSGKDTLVDIYTFREGIRKSNSK
jgi:hypothetical protein